MLMQYFFLNFIFQSSLKFMTKLKGRCRDTSCLHTHVAFPIINIPYQSDTFVTIHEPTLPRLNHKNSMAYLTVHIWCCIFYGFAQMYNDMCSSLQYHTEYYCPKNLVLCLFILSSFPKVVFKYTSFYIPLIQFNIIKQNHILIIIAPRSH